MCKNFFIASYKNRLLERLKDISFLNLEVYTIASSIGNELTELYKSIMEETIGELVFVKVNEISDRKYEVIFTMPNCKEYKIISKAWYTKDNIHDVVMEVIINYLKDLWKNRKLEILCSKNITA